MHPSHPKKASYSNYTDIQLFLKLLEGNPAEKPLLGLFIIFSGIHPRATRSFMRAWAESLGAQTGDSAAHVKPGAIVLINHYANKGWKDATDSGLKIQRAEQVGAYRFPFSQVQRVLKELNVPMPEILNYEDQLALPLS